MNGAKDSVMKTMDGAKDSVVKTMSGAKDSVVKTMSDAKDSVERKDVSMLKKRRNERQIDKKNDASRLNDANG